MDAMAGEPFVTAAAKCFTARVVTAVVAEAAVVAALLVVLAVDPPDVVVPALPVGWLASVLTGLVVAPEVWLDVASVVPVLLADDPELPVCVGAALATADPLASAAPTPRVSAPAPSQADAGARR